MQKSTAYSVGILLCFSILCLLLQYIFHLTKVFFGQTPSAAVVFTNSRFVLWLVVLLMFFYSKFVEKGQFLLWNERSYRLKFYLIAIPVVYLIAVFGSGIINALLNLITQEKISERLLDLRPIFKNNLLLILLTCVTAAVVEEFLLRGYIQPRLKFIYSNQWVGILGSSLLFGVLHAGYGTIAQLVGTFTIGFVFAFFYEKYRNIKILIICHFLIDFISIMALTYLHRP